jgi:hypothetical protein
MMKQKPVKKTLNEPTTALPPRVLMSCVNTVLMWVCGRCQQNIQAMHASQTLASLTAAASDGAPETLVQMRNFLEKKAKIITCQPQQEIGLRRTAVNLEAARVNADLLAEHEGSKVLSAVIETEHPA